MKVRKLLWQIAPALIAGAVLMFTGCKGEKGATGPAGGNAASRPVITAVQATPDSIGAGQSTQLLVAAYDPNGDTLHYEWSSGGQGSFTSTNLSTTRWTAPHQAGVYPIFITVSAGGDTTRDSVMVGVAVAAPSTARGYLGNDGTVCAPCHSTITAGWSQTIHASAWDSLGADTTNLYCVQCHTTGFDDRYDVNGNLLSTGPDTTGYDNTRDPRLRNVQCESCHGPMGPPPLNHAPIVVTSLKGQTCSQCHPAWPEYIQSAHYTAMQRAGGQAAFLAEWGNSTCDPCHVSEGFLRTHDPDWMAGVFSAQDANQVTCVTCHQPHRPTPENEEQLRTVGDVTSPFSMVNPDSGSYTISGWNNGQLCAQCHHARRNKTQIRNQITVGDPHPGPHPSPQADMVSGQGDLELGPVERTNQHPFSDERLSDVCVSCHIRRLEFTDPGGPAYGHTFQPQLSTCQQCHPGASDFDINGVQTHVTALLDSLAALLPHDSTGAVRSSIDTVNWTADQRKAGYTYFFVEDDKSRGVHNRNYAISILRDAIAFLTGSPG